jgi:hypothetical protein
MAERLSRVLFGVALLIGSFAYGVIVGRYEVFPYELIHKANVTLRTALDRFETGPDASIMFQRFSEIDRAEATAKRFRPLGTGNADEPLLVYGGMHQFREVCPELGCIAVEFARSGEVMHAYPYRPNEIFAANITDEYPYEALGFDFAALVRPVGIERYSDGDLLVIFQGADMFPFGAGAARIDREGHPRWFRFDYSHHWPTLLPGGRALVPAMAIGRRPIEVPVHSGKTIRLECKSKAPHHDTIRLLDGDGAVLRELSVLDAVLQSPHRAVLQETTDGCDPIHLNYVDVVGEGAASAIKGIDPGDLVVSLRNISAFGFLDGGDGRLKRLVRGTFFQQHGVQHWRDAIFLMFDNHGGGAEGGPSRLLAVDLATGEERTIFPTRDHPPHLQGAFSDTAGSVHIAPDGERAFVVFSTEGKAYEIRLADGAVLTEYDHVHDVAMVDSLPEKRTAKGGVFVLYGVDYIGNQQDEDGT